MDYFSARLLFVSLVDDGRPKKRNFYDESVIVFRARGFPDALRRAVSIGKSKEFVETNPLGQQQRWAFVEVINLDWIGDSIDGAEVASKLHYRNSDKPISAKRKFRPEQSTPEGSF